MAAIHTTHWRNFARDLQDMGQQLMVFGAYLDNIESDFGEDVLNPLAGEFGDMDRDEDDLDGDICLMAGQVLLSLGMMNPFWGQWTGPCGQYFQFLKSSDFFCCSLQWPDCWFQHLYWYVHLPFMAPQVWFMNKDGTTHVWSSHHDPWTWSYLLVQRQEATASSKVSARMLSSMLWQTGIGYIWHCTEACPGGWHCHSVLPPCHLCFVKTLRPVYCLAEQGM